MDAVETADPVISPVFEPVQADPASRDEVSTRDKTRRLVTVHCSFSAIATTGIRIWNSTFLVDKVSASKSKMVEAIGIPVAPTMMIVKPGTTARFTLIFEALPDTCEIFDLIEEALEPYGFEAINIRRNETDVYTVPITTPFLNSLNTEN
ncbi:MAG: hypothetical protein ACOYNC_06410 [Bacteroidales bacterium]